MDNIQKFYQNTENSLPHPMVKRFINMNIKAGDAIDLGCGAGRDTIYLIRNGWKVLAIDRENTNEMISSKLNDEELKRLNAEIVKMNEQIARLMILHQMLGTRISDTLTLRTDCLRGQPGDRVVHIRQMKTHPYEKPVSEEIAILIERSIQYTKKKWGETEYIFVSDSDPSLPAQYNRIQTQVVQMIREKDLRDDYGRLFGFGTHMYRHYYGVKLTEMHLDDWTIARLLGHSSVHNVKYYRKMSNQILADETRKVRERLSQLILENLDGWGEEYEQVRYDVSCK
mgnify:CR=1 FL=1